MIVVSSVDRVGLVELDRPDRRNALDAAQCRRLVDAVAELVAADVRVIVVTGRGSSFCSGADFGEVHTDGFRGALHAALRAVADAPVPTVAAVNGPAIGAGTQLAIACDLRIADPSAVFGVPTAQIGLAVDPWTVRRLARLAGGGTARSVLLACDRIDAALAHSRGLVDRIGDRAAALEWAAGIAALAPLTLRYSALALDRDDLADDDPPCSRRSRPAGAATTGTRDAGPAWSVDPPCSGAAETRHDRIGWTPSLPHHTRADGSSIPPNDSAEDECHCDRGVYVVPAGRRPGADPLADRLLRGVEFWRAESG